jgi:hypothetical protein
MSTSRTNAMFGAAALVAALTACASSTTLAHRPATTLPLSTDATSTSPLARPSQASPSLPASSTSTTTTEPPTPVSSSADFIAKGQQYTPVIDGVHLTIQTDTVPPSGLADVSQPGTPVQHAAAQVDGPYRSFELSAVAYGRRVYGEPSFPQAGPDMVDTWRQVEISQSGAVGTASDGPAAMIFGKPVLGTVIHRVDAPLAGKQIHIEKIFWIVEAGNRIWELSIERDLSGLATDYGTGIEITSNDLAAPTTM